MLTKAAKELKKDEKAPWATKNPFGRLRFDSSDEESNTN